jgi:hypothetical protein
MDSYGYVWLGLIVLPPIAWVLAALLWKHPKPLNIARTVGGAWIGATLLAFCLKFSFRSPAANIDWLLGVYFACAFIAFSNRHLRPAVLKIAVTIVAALPVFSGYVLATVGMLGLASMLNDASRAPVAATFIKPGYGCQIKPWGDGPGDEGYTVRLYAYWGSFAKREIDHLIVDETHPERGDASSATCMNVVAKHWPAQSGL